MIGTVLTRKLADPAVFDSSPKLIAKLYPVIPTTPSRIRPAKFLPVGRAIPLRHANQSSNSFEIELSIRPYAMVNVVRHNVLMYTASSGRVHGLAKRTRTELSVAPNVFVLFILTGDPPFLRFGYTQMRTAESRPLAHRAPSDIRLRARSTHLAAAVAVARFHRRRQDTYIFRIHRAPCLHPAHT